MRALENMVEGSASSKSYIVAKQRSHDSLHGGPRVNVHSNSSELVPTSRTLAWRVLAALILRKGETTLPWAKFRFMKYDNAKTDLGFLLLLIFLHEKTLHAILLHAIALHQRVFMRPRNTISLAVSTVAIDPLNCIVSLACSTRVTCRNCSVDKRHSELLLLMHCLSSRLSWRKEVVAKCWIWVAAIRRKIRAQHGTRKVFCDLDLDVAQVSFSGGTLALLLVGIVRLWGSRWSSFESAVPVMRDKGFALVALG